jgi:hypothetical protein
MGSTKVPDVAIDEEVEVDDARPESLELAHAEPEDRGAHDFAFRIADLCRQVKA